MDGLSPKDLRVACGVLHERYKTCIKTTVVSALASADLGSVSSRCAPLFADLTEHCSELIRRGELQVQAAPPGAPPTTGR